MHCVTTTRQRCAARCAVEGDVRLLEQQSISNWQTGQLEVFFEGSWGSVCARFFNGPDANVACRQLGYVAGTRQPQLLRSSGPAAESAPDLDVFPVVNLAGPGCSGTEATLLECGVDTAFARSIGSQQECFGTGQPGLRIGCVVAAEEGAHGDQNLLRPDHGLLPGTHAPHACCQRRAEVLRHPRQAGAAASALQDASNCKDVSILLPSHLAAKAGPRQWCTSQHRLCVLYLCQT